MDLPKGGIKVLAQGLTRAQIDEISADNDILEAAITPLTFDKGDTQNEQIYFKIKEIADKLLDRLIEAAKELYEKVMPWVIEQLEKFAEWLNENGPLIEDFAVVVLTAFGDIADAVVRAWDFILPILDAMITTILGLAKVIMQVATGDWAGAWETMKTTANDVWESIKEAIGAFVNWILGFLGTNWETVKEVWQNNWDMLVLIVETLWDKLSEACSTIVNNIIAFFDGVRSDFVQIGTNIVNDIKAGLVGAWESLRTWVSNAIRGLISLAKSVLGIGSPSSEFITIGMEIVSGISKGLDDWWDGLVDRAKDRFGGLIGLAKQIFGIHSASEVFRKIGEDIVEGFKEGFDDKFSKDMPEILSKWEQFGEDLLDAIDDKFDDIADEALEMQEEIVKVAESLGSIAAGFSSILGKTTIDPLEESIEQYTDRLESLRESIASYGPVGAIVSQMLEQGTNLYQIEQLLRSVSPDTLTDTQRSALLAFAQSYIYTQEQLAILNDELIEQQERLYALEQKRMQLNLLEQQLKLLSLLDEYDIGADIFTGIEFGLNANIEAMIDGLVEAMDRMITAVQDKLGVASPSKVFQRIGEQMMEGLAIGIAGGAHLPSMALAGATPSTTNYWNLTINEAGRQTDAAQSFAFFQALAGAG